MRDLFTKEVTPFARITYGNWPSSDKQEGLYWEERWKFTDKTIYNRATRVVWIWSAKEPARNWIDLQRRIKHLFSSYLELDTMMEWIIEGRESNILGFVKFTTGQETEIGSDQLQFWSMDREFHLYGVNDTNLSRWSNTSSEINQIICEAIDRWIKLGSDEQLIAVTKQLNLILKNLYNRITCTCPWNGIISGGPMLPYQKFLLSQSESALKGFFSFEFRIACAKPKDLGWIKDLKLPTLSETSNIWIHHGINRS